MKFLPMDERYIGYFSDESRLCGRDAEITFPENTQELQGILISAAESGKKVRFQGARTGLCGGAVPNGEAVINLERMNEISPIIERGGAFCLRAQAGATMAEIEKLARARGMFFPAAPTEKSATIGGVFAAGGAGPTALCYGVPSSNVARMTWLTKAGALWEIARGGSVFAENECQLPDGRVLKIPHKTASPVAAFPRPCEGCDLIDFLAGSEGTLGVAAELEFALRPFPREIWGIVLFFTDKTAEVAYIEALRKWRGENAKILLCAEYFDTVSLGLLTKWREKNARLKGLSPFPQNAVSAIYVELAADDPEWLEDALNDQLDLFAAVGGNEEDTWAESGYSAIEDLRDMRHALPEIIALETGYDGTESSRVRCETDFAAAPEKVLEYIEMYASNAQKAGVECAVYGHVLQNHLHAALLYKSEEQFQCAQELVDKWAQRVVDDSGFLVSANGEGRLKTELLERYRSEQECENIRYLQEFFSECG